MGEYVRMSLDRWKFLCEIYRSMLPNRDCGRTKPIKLTFEDGSLHVSDVSDVSDAEAIISNDAASKLLRVLSEVCGSIPSTIWLSASLWYIDMSIVYACQGYILVKSTDVHSDDTVVVGCGACTMPDYKRLIPFGGNNYVYLKVDSALLSEISDFMKSSGEYFKEVSLWRVCMPGDVPILMGYGLSGHAHVAYGRGNIKVDRVLESVCRYLEETDLGIDDVFWADGLVCEKSHIVARGSNNALVIGC